MEIIQTKTRLNLISDPSDTHSYIHVINKINFAGAPAILYPYSVGPAISEHELVKDGYYKVIEIKLPKVGVGGYYITGGLIYDVSGSTITVEELLAVQTLGTAKTEIDYVSMYIIKTFYTNLIKTKYLQGLCTCGCATPMEKITVDSLTMGLIIADELLLNSQYFEIQNLIEKLEICTGFALTSNCNCNG